MVNTSPHPGITFQGKDPQETFQFYYRQHWIRLLWPFVRMAGLTAILIGVEYLFFEQIQPEGETGRHGVLLLVFGFFTLVQWEFLVRFYRHFLSVIIVTDKKIHRIKKTLVFLDTHQSIDLWVLQDIKKTQRGIIQNILGFGTLILEAQDSELRIHFTPKIGKRYNDLMHLRERARHQETSIPLVSQTLAKGKKKIDL